MRFSVDLHMHSCLSPCAEDEMTPNNMANMAMLKELDIVALTDHNSYYNTAAFNKICVSNNILPICGMEVTSAEEIHIVVLMKDYETLQKFGDLVFKSLMEVENKPNIFGNQFVLDEDDELIRSENRLLISATSLTTDDIFSFANTLGGVAIPAHIDRNSYSMLESFGVIPEELNIKMLELSKCSNIYFFKKLHPELAKYKFYRSSDAHNLSDMFEKEDNVFELEEKSIECLFKYLRETGEDNA